MSRKRFMDTSGAEPKSKKTKHWSLGLLDSMKDPENIVKETKDVVVIRDKYPKAKIHYLVLPRKNISSIYNLNREHIDLLEEFYRIFKEFDNKFKGSKLKAGFHAVPSMQRLHMHVLSEDMISPCLKTKVHWNSFCTSFFLPCKDVIKELKDTGSIERISPDTHKSLMTTPLKCNQCSSLYKTMPQLKEHLLSHLCNDLSV